MCIGAEIIRSNQWINYIPYSHTQDGVREQFQLCLLELDVYFARKNAILAEQRSIKARYNLCVSLVICHVTKMEHTITLWKMFATTLPLFDLKRNILAIRILRSMTNAKRKHTEYLQSKALAREAHAAS